MGRSPILLLALCLATIGVPVIGQADDVCVAVIPATTDPTSNDGLTYPELLMSLVAAVDEAEVFPDSKTVIDMPLIESPMETYAAFEALGLPDPIVDIQEYQTNATLNATLLEFVNEYLTPPGSELVNVTGLTAAGPPAWFANISDADYAEFANDLFAIWGDLTRVVSPNVSANPELYTLIPVPEPFVIPGARFREAYYWDSFFIIQGLLASGLDELATGMLANFAHLIAEFGHIPNGIRTYYLNRSQPPLFSEMVRVVYEATGNVSVLEDNLPALLAEHEYWTSSPKSVAVTGPDGLVHNLTRYYAEWDEPRPESYREDQATAAEAGCDLENPSEECRQLWRDLATGAETGWDYSTRWFADNSTDLTTIRTTRIIPADLNAFLYQMETNLANFADDLGCNDTAAELREAATARRASIQALQWNPETNQWHDLVCSNITLNEDGPSTCESFVQNTDVFPSNWFPLYGGVADADSNQALAAVESFNASGLLQVGGVSASLVDSGQQWDAPNAWPPIQALLIGGFDEYGGAEGQAVARQIADTYLDTAYTTYEETGANFEKFNATAIGLPGGGGEYEVVSGFGWTNGVALHLIQMYYGPESSTV